MSARSTRSFNRDINSGKGSFNSSLTRSNSTHSVRAAMDKGGPGEYDSSHLFGCGTSTPCTSSFASATPLGGHVRKSDTPGAGEYDPKEIEGGTGRKDGGTAVFAGTSRPRGASGFSATGEAVGPGSYEVEQTSLHHQMVSKINHRLPPFNSSSVRQGPEA